MLRVECPRCGSAMQQETFDGRLGRSVAIDICHACQSFWFDTRESVALTPGATLALFRIIGEKLTRPRHSDAELAKCPRCKGRLRRTRDMQRGTKFEYLNCPNGHGRLISFFDFLREKDFIRPLSTRQIAELRENVGAVNCTNCGGAVDLTKGTACPHCGSPLSMLDIHQAEQLVSQLQKAEDRANQPVDPSLPLQLLRVRRETERAFAGLPHDDVWVEDVLKTDLVGAGLSAVARWLKRHS
ncbi:MAG TPA: zf-TFIIB domain-containing protein [Vicinamibacterales bacterium]|nr:zf-TFIIB domain-containing protein [Vicinamibacterales bacterium]